MKTLLAPDALCVSDGGGRTRAALKPVRGADSVARFMAGVWKKGALEWDAAAKRFRVNEGKMDGAIRELVAAIVRLQGNGDYAGTRAFLDRYGTIDAEAQQVIDTMSGIPVDIRPIYPDRI